MQINIVPPINDTAEAWSAYIKELWESAENHNRKRDSKIAVDYYNNKQLPYLEKELRRIFTDPASYATKRKFTKNVTKQIIDALAQCYSCKVKRSVSGLGKKASKVLDEKVFQGLNKAMRNANKWLVLERTTLLYGRWNQKKERITYRSYHQFQFDLVYKPNSDRELMAVILSDYKPLKDARIWVYTENNTYLFFGDEVKSQLNHNNNVLPFTVLYAEDPGFNDYLDPDINLANSNLEINIAISNLLNMQHHQTHAVPVFVLPPEVPMAGVDDANPDLGVARQIEGDRRIDINDLNKALVLTRGEDGSDTDFKYVSPSADFQGSIESIRFAINSLAQTYGVDNGIFDIDVSGNPATVFHVNEKRRQAIVGDLQSAFTDAEKDLFSSVYRLSQLSSTEIPSLDVDRFLVEFISDASIVEQLSSGDVVNLYNAGLIDEVEVIRHHYGEYSRTEAVAFIEMMINQRKKLEELKSQIGLGEQASKEISEEDEPIEE